LFQQLRDVVSHLLVAERPIDVAGMTMALQLDADHAPSLRQHGPKFPEVGLDVREGAV
jgi:hypothetical protein